MFLEQAKFKMGGFPMQKPSLSILFRFMLLNSFVSEILRFLSTFGMISEVFRISRFWLKSQRHLSPDNFSHLLTFFLVFGQVIIHPENTIPHAFQRSRIFLLIEMPAKYAKRQEYDFVYFVGKSKLL